MEAPQLAALQESLLRRQWRYLWRRSDFYRDKLSGAGYTPDDEPSLSDLSALPFTWKEEIRKSLASRPPLGSHLAVDRRDLRQVHTSGGTSGQPSLVGLTSDDWEQWTELIRRGYAAVGYLDADTVLHAYSMSQAWVGGLPMTDGVTALGATILPIGAEAGSDRILSLMQPLAPSAIQATPGFLIHLAERALSTGVDPTKLGVRLMLTGGEPGGGIPATRGRIVELWGAPVREVMGGTDLACMMWAECEAEDGMHFLAPDAVLFEIIDPGTEAPVAVEPGCEGELVYSHLARKASPVLRFRHRDLVRVTGVGRCSCGRTTPRIRCFGRSDDMLIVKGVNLFPTSIQAALAEHAGVGPDFRIVRPRGAYVLPGPVRLEVEADSEATVTAHELAGRLRAQLSCRFTIEYVPRGSLTVVGAQKSRFFEEL